MSGSPRMPPQRAGRTIAAHRAELQVAYDRKYLKISWLFRDTSSLEVAVTSLHVAGTSTSYDPVPDLPSYDATVCETLLTAYGTMLGAGAITWANYSSLHGIKVAAIDTAGHYLTDPVVHERTGTAIHGGSTEVLPQCTVVLSLWSGASLGKGNYGRMYLPHTRLTLNTSSSVAASTTQTALKADAKTFLNAVNTVAGGISTGTGLRIPSNVGFNKAVAYVRIGKVTDTQRRRLNALDEDLAFGTVAL